MKNNNMFNDVSIFVLYFVTYFYMKKGSKGSDLVNILEVPEMIQKVLENVRGP